METDDKGGVLEFNEKHTYILCSYVDQWYDTPHIEYLSYLHLSLNMPFC